MHGCVLGSRTGRFQRVPGNTIQPGWWLCFGLSGHARTASHRTAEFHPPATNQAIVIVEAFVAVGFPVLRLGSAVFLPQPSPDARPDLPLHLAKHFTAVGVVEVPYPPLRLTVDAGDEVFGFPPLGAPGGLFPDGRPQFVAAFRAGLTMRVAFASSRFPPCQQEPQELDALFLKVHDACLLLVELESPFLQPAFQPTVHLRALPFTAEHYEVVGISHHHRFHLPASIDSFIQPVEIEVG